MPMSPKYFVSAPGVSVPSPPPYPATVTVANAYIFWLFGFLGLGGMHRLYLGRYGSGILWLLTGGLCGIGQLIDLFLIPSMVKERNALLWAYANQQTAVPVYSLMAADPLGPTTMVMTPQQVPDVKDPLHILLEAAATHDNVLSMGQAVLTTGMTPIEIEPVLGEAMRRGIAYVGNDPETGAVRYYFDI